MALLEKISVRLFLGDFKRLQRKYPTSGAGAALRVLLRNHLEKVDQKAEDLEVNLDPLSNVELSEEDQENANCKS